MREKREMLDIGSCLVWKSQMGSEPCVFFCSISGGSNIICTTCGRGGEREESEDLAKEEGKYGFLAGVNVAFEEGVGRR